ncbi:MAG: helix-turn-helix domain-containing protein [Patescibacteria group bacterium]
MSAQKDFYSITREEAAEKLGISIRTLDRYLKRGKLKAKLSPSRQVLIHAQDLERVAKILAKIPAPKKSSSKEKTFAASAEAEAFEIPTEAVEEKIFRELYEEANKDLKAKQEKLEAASFRVGQLEAQLKSSVPLLEFKQKESEMQGENSKLKERLIAAILKSWVFLGVAILATIVATVLSFLKYL